MISPEIAKRLVSAGVICEYQCIHSSEFGCSPTEECIKLKHFGDLSQLLGEIEKRGYNWWELEKTGTTPGNCTSYRFFPCKEDEDYIKSTYEKWADSPEDAAALALLEIIGTVVSSQEGQLSSEARRENDKNNQST